MWKDSLVFAVHIIQVVQNHVDVHRSVVINAEMHRHAAMTLLRGWPFREVARLSTWPSQAQCRITVFLKSSSSFTFLSILQGFNDTFGPALGRYGEPGEEHGTVDASFRLVLPVDENAWNLQSAASETFVSITQLWRRGKLEIMLRAMANFAIPGLLTGYSGPLCVLTGGAGYLNHYISWRMPTK